MEEMHVRIIIGDMKDEKIGTIRAVSLGRTAVKEGRRS